MSELETLIQRITRFRDERDWKQFHHPKDMILSLFMESAELAEHFQWKSDREIEELIATRRGELGDELADILYWVLLLGHDLGIDLSAAFEAKMQKNETKYPAERARGRSTKYDEL